MSPFPPANSGQWTTGLCACLGDCQSCCLGYWCPCVMIGRYIEIIDQGSTTCLQACIAWYCLQCCTGCGCCYTCGYRSRLRQKFGLPASPCGDCCVECCCGSCSMCQIYRELKNRNIDPSLGYVGVRHIYDNPAINTVASAPGQQAMYK